MLRFVRNAANAVRSRLVSDCIFDPKRPEIQPIKPDPGPTNSGSSVSFKSFTTDSPIFFRLQNLDLGFDLRRIDWDIADWRVLLLQDPKFARVDEQHRIRCEAGRSRQQIDKAKRKAARDDDYEDWELTANKSRELLDHFGNSKRIFGRRLTIESSDALFVKI